MQIEKGVDQGGKKKEKGRVFQSSDGGGGNPGVILRDLNERRTG